LPGCRARLYVISWHLSTSLDVGFCLRALADALRVALAPHIFNSDQGSQSTSLAYEQALLDAGCRISRDDRGRATDNAFTSASGAPPSGSTSTSTPPTMATTYTTNCECTLLTTVIVDQGTKRPPKSSRNHRLPKYKHIT
jgi:hypothetical protein